MRRRRHRRGFTLVELVVTIGIIILLAALTLSVSVAVVEGSEVRQTETTIRLLDTAIKQWELSSDRKVGWGTFNEPQSGDRYDMEDGTPHVLLISELLDAVGRSSEIRQTIARIDPDFVHQYDSTAGAVPSWLARTDPDDPDPNVADALGDFENTDWDGSLAVLDAWDLPIRVVHPGRLWDDVVYADDVGEEPHEDGTIRLELNYGSGTYGVEQFYGIARNREILFVSAGPDGKFGNLSVDPVAEPDLFEQTKDNLYSYEPIKETLP